MDPHDEATRTDTDRMTAIHEAAHATVAHMLGLTVSHLEIVGNRSELGSCHTLRLPRGEAVARERALEDALLVSCAGIVAESLERGDSGWDETSPDLDAAVRIALQLTGDCERAYARLLRTRRRLRKALSRHWDAVEALAAALLKARRLNGREVEAILEPELSPRRRGAEDNIRKERPAPGSDVGGALHPQGQ